MIALNISVSDFWKMTPREFKWIYDFKFPPKSMKKNEVERLKKLFDLPEARDSKG